MKKQIIITIVTIVAIALIFPFFFEYMILRNEFNSVISNSDWIGFSASFYGGVIGGIATLVAVLFSLNENNKFQKNVENKYREDRLIDLMPVITIDNSILKEKYTKLYNLPDDGCYDQEVEIGVKNIGKGITFDTIISYSINGINNIAIKSNLIGCDKSETINFINRTELNLEVIKDIEITIYFKDFDSNLYFQKFQGDYYLNTSRFEIYSSTIPDFIMKECKIPTLQYINENKQQF